MTDRARILKAVDRLAAALAELAYTDRISIRPDIRMLLAPEDPTSSEVRHLHALGLTPELAELLADTVERLITDRAASEVPDPFNAHIFALAMPELATEIRSAFTGIDVDDLTRTLRDNSDNGEDEI